MNTILVLPNTTLTSIPEYLLKDRELHHFTPEERTINAFAEIDLSLQSYAPPLLIVGSDTTPAIYWILIKKHFPEIPALLHCTDGLIDIDSGESVSSESVHVEPPLEDSSTQVYSSSVKADEPTVLLREAPIISGDTPLAHKKDGEILFQIKRLSSWGLTEKNTIHQVDNLLLEAAARSVRTPGFFDRAKKSKSDGIKAYSLFEEEIKARVRSLSDTAFQDYFSNLCVEHKLSKSVRHLVNDKIKKERAFLNRKKKQMSQQPYRKVKCTFPPITFSGSHPNSLRHQKPQDQWDILIDETGSNFENSSYQLNASDKSVGKCIALAIPKNMSNALLPAIGKHHAADATDAVNDRIIQSLLGAPVGILGFTVQDQINTHDTSWFNAIHLLIRWVLRLVPINPEKQTTISFFIEQRSSYNERINLMPIIDVLMAELSELNPERYRNITLKAQFISKENDHPLNGYIDTVAHMWGSSMPPSKERLRNSKLLGHCLLRPSDTALDRLYQSISDIESLTPADWYSLIRILDAEPEGSLIHHTLDALGANVQKNPCRWQLLLSELQRVLSEYYEAREVKNAFDWLERWCPDGFHLSGLVKLQHLAVELDSLNHLGIYTDRIEHIFKEMENLRTSLFDEAAHRLCEIDLRIMVSLTNIYEFDRMKDILRYWLQKDTAAITLLTRGKLLSTEGQYYAFQGFAQKALPSFKAAQSLFDMLSDTELGQRNRKWTESYRITALMDVGGVATEEIRSALLNYLNNDLSEKRIKRVARSGDESRFEHYLFLRALLYFPDEFAEESKVYLGVFPEWQSGGSAPWEIINLYRSILLFKKGKKCEAKQYAEEAIKICDNEMQGITTRWIGGVIHLLSLKMGILPSDRSIDISSVETLVKAHPAFPLPAFKRWSETISIDTHEKIIQMLQELLPFNFH